MFKKVCNKTIIHRYTVHVHTEIRVGMLQDGTNIPKITRANVVVLCRIPKNTIVKIDSMFLGFVLGSRALQPPQMYIPKHVFQLLSSNVVNMNL